MTETSPQQGLTLVFTDIEGSSALWEQFDDDFMVALEAHNELLRGLCEKLRGEVVKEEGDAFFLVFPKPQDALQFALQAQQALREYDWSRHGPEGLRVRMGLHFGRAWRREDDYFGPQVNKTARICDAGHGGQVLASQEFMDACGEPGSEVVIADLARHRLRGLGEPQHLYQLTLQDWGQQEWPVLRTLDDIPTNLPAQVTSFVGRDKELEELAELLADDGTRLMTLTGPGGSGKSRLAQQAAAQVMEHFPDGVFWIELADITSPDAVVGAIMQVLKIQPEAGRIPVEQIAAYCKGRELLLALDNFEHVIDAAATVAELLQLSTEAKLLITSRELLHIPGEHIYEVMPLALPEPPINWQTLSQYDSVHLFLHRAEAAGGGFEISIENAAAVAETCVRLDGIPLAIELAAAWVRDFTPAQILQQLGLESRVLSSRVRGVADRQRTLANTMEWSYRLLSEDDQRVFRFLSVFQGGFFLDAAEAVCGPGATDSVITLHDKSLLYSREALDQQRFYMLATIREFATSRLVESGEEDQASAVHHKCFLAVAEELAERGGGGRTKQFCDQCRLEAGNLLQALRYVALRSEFQKMFVLLNVLHRAGDDDPRVAREMQPALEQLWEVAQDHRGERWTGVIAINLMDALVNGGNHEEALRRAQDCYAVADATGDFYLRYKCARHATVSAMNAGRPDLIRHWLAESEKWEKSPKEIGGQASVYAYIGMHERAMATAREALALLSPADPARLWYSLLYSLADACFRGGHIEEAYETAQEILQLVEGPLHTDVDVAQHGRCLAVPIFALTGHVEKATQLAREAADAIAQLPPEAHEFNGRGLVQQCNFARLWDLGLVLAEQLSPASRPEDLPVEQQAWHCPVMAEAYARTGRTQEAVATLEVLLSAGLDRDADPYYTGRALKSVGEVLRAAGKPAEAATVTEVASCQLDNQPFLKSTCEELLELIAQDLSPEELAAAREAAADLQPSAAIALAREALDLPRA